MTRSTRSDHRGARCLLATGAALTALALPAVAAAQPLKECKTVPLTLRTRSPSFASSTPLRMVDRSRRVFIGTGITKEHETMYMLRLKDLNTETAAVPLDSYVRGNPGILLTPGDRRPAHEQFWIRHLLFYDTVNKEAGVEVSDRFGNNNVRRHFFIHWDLRRQKLTQATLVARGRPGASHAASVAMGYDHARKEFYYARQIYRTGTQRRTVSVIGFIAGKPRVVAQFRSERAIQATTYFDQPRQRAVLVEYAELATPTPPPRGHMVNLATGKVVSFPVPLTCYGVAFGASGKRIYAYSAQLGELWVLDATTGKRLQKQKAGKQGHALGLISPKQLLLIRNTGLRSFDVGKRLRRRGFIPMSKFYKGFSNVDGSLVIRGGALVKNGEELHVVSSRCTP